jgi:hypothetical protein
MPDTGIDLYQELLLLTDAVTQAGIPYALCGGLAVGIYGYPRFTKDIDLLLLPEDEARLVEVARGLGYILTGGRMPVSDGSVTDWEIARVSKVVGSEILVLDMLLVGGSIQSVWDTRELIGWQGRQLAIVSRSGLKRLKQIAGRRQDLLDLEQLGLEP